MRSNFYNSTCSFESVWNLVSHHKGTQLRVFENRRVKVKLPLCFLTEYPAMKAYWGSERIAPCILWPRHQMVVSGQLHDPAALPPGTHWIGGWVGPRAVLDAVVKRKIPSPRRESNPRSPIIQPVAQRYTDWAITALIGRMVKSKRLRLAWHVSRTKKTRNAYKIFVTLKTGSWGKYDYMDIKGKKWQEDEDNFTMSDEI
jgi:hypothetical protein